jgi:HK97 family phage major capsid protein
MMEESDMDDVSDAIADATSAIEEFKQHNESRFEEIERRLSRLDAKANRPRIFGGDDGDGFSSASARRSAETKAFLNYCRRGIERIDPTERKALFESVDPGAGYLAPTDYQTELIRNLIQFSPVRQVARVGTTNSGSVRLPKRNAALTGSWLPEQTPRSESDNQYALEEIVIGEIACYIEVSNAQLEDSAFDLGAELATDFGQSFAKTEGTAFINGTGINQPEGVLQNTAIGEMDCS